MNYIYDIYLNLSEKLYDFFEWNKSDNLIHIKKIPVFIIESSKLRSIMANNIIVDNHFINRIANKTEIWTPNIKLTYCALFCDNNDLIAIEFDKNGLSIRRSNLYIDEESDVLEDIKQKKSINIEFKIKNRIQYTFKTRKQIKIENFVNQELKNIDNTKLKYICYECLGITNGDIRKLKKIKHTSADYKNLYNILKLTSKGLK